MGRNIVQKLLLSIRPEDLYLFDAGEGPKAKVHQGQRTRCIADGAGHFVPLIADANACTDGVDDSNVCR